MVSYQTHPVFQPSFSTQAHAPVTYMGAPQVAHMAVAPPGIASVRSLALGAEKTSEVDLRTVNGMLEERVSQLMKELEAEREHSAKMSLRAEVAHQEAASFAEDLRVERLAREEVEAILSEIQLTGNMEVRRPVPSGRAPPGRSGSAKSLQAPPGRAPVPSGSGKPGLGTPSRRSFTASTSSRQPSARVQPLRQKDLGKDRARDEIDVRLTEFLERTPDNILTFRRLNRGWYAFRHYGERGPLCNDRSVELSVVNGKLMAKLEPTTHEAGWNNGKQGPIERFVAHFASLLPA